MLEVTERGLPLRFLFEDVLRYHGGHSPGGAAIAYKVLERALPALGPCERRAIEVETAFGGPGARDAFEIVTRAVTDGRYRVGDELARTRSSSTSPAARRGAGGPPHALPAPAHGRRRAEPRVRSARRGWARACR